MAQLEDEATIGELTAWLTDRMGVDPAKAQYVAERAFTKVARGGNLGRKFTVTSADEAERIVVELREQAVVEANQADIESDGEVVEDRTVFDLVDKDVIRAEAEVSAARLFQGAVEADDESTTDERDMAAANVMSAGSRVEEDEGFMGTLRTAAEAEMSDNADLGATDLLMSLRALYGFDLSDNDIDNLEDAILESGEYRVPTDDDDRVAIIQQEITRFMGEDPDQSPAVRRAFGDVGSGHRRVRGQVRVDGRWVDYDPDDESWLYAPTTEAGKRQEYERVKSIDPDGGELGWEVYGWLDHANVQHLENWFWAIASEEEVDAPYLAAVIEGLGAEGELGWGEWTEEEVLVLTSNDREVTYKDDSTGTRVTHRFQHNQGWRHLQGVTTEITGKRWDAAQRKWGEATSTKTQKGDRGVGAGSAIAVARQQREAKREMDDIRSSLKDVNQRRWGVKTSAFKKLNSWKAFARSAAQRAKAGEQKYGYQGAGLLSAIGHGALAEALHSGRANGDQLYAIDQKFANARYDMEAATARSRNRIAASRARARYVQAWENYYSRGGGGGRRGGGGGGGTVVKAVAKLPSEEDVKNSMTTLFRSWFRRDPTDGEVAGVKKMLDGVIIHEANQAANAQAYGGSYTESDKEALILDHLRKSPEYQKLFAGKSGGETEEEYAGRFEQSAAELFGREMAQNDDAVRAGMLESTEQTTLGYLAGTKAANDSSSFQERLSQAARIIAEMT